MRLIILMLSLTLCCLSVVSAYGKDPTKPISYRPALFTATEASMQLNGIIIGPGHRLAMIDGQPYSVNEKLGAWTVTAISADKVVLTDHNQRLILELIPSIITKEPCTNQGCP